MKAFFEFKRVLSGTDATLKYIGDWSIEQFQWLDEQREAFVCAEQKNHLEIFWADVFKIFFTTWPVRRILWPTMYPIWSLTTTEQRCVCEVEERYKLVSMFD
jgi:hypothetical protein